MNFIFTALCLLLFCIPSSAQKQSADLLIKDVSIVQIAEGKVIPNQVIVIKGDRIVETGSAMLLKKYEAKQIIHALGKFIMPGLWDMHVHFGGDTLVDDNEQLLPLFLAMGVTTVRDAAGDISVDVLKWRQQINEGKRMGPRIFTSGPKLEGKKSVWPGDLEIENEAELKLALDSLKKLKVDFIKITDNTLTPALYLESIRHARQRGWKTSGHIPSSFTLLEASTAGLSTIGHMNRVLRAAYGDEEQLIRQRKDDQTNGRPLTRQLSQTMDTGIAVTNFRRLAANGTAVVPTMIGGYITAFMDQNDHLQDDYLNYIGPELKRTWKARRNVNDHATTIAARHQQFETNASFLRLLYRAGVTIIAGTDAGYMNSFIYPGIGLHQELALMVNYGGITPQAALTASVINGPAFFGLQDEYGAVSKHKKADLLLLAANPLIDINATQGIYAVVRNGIYMNLATLDKSLQAIQIWVKQKNLYIDADIRLSAYSCIFQFCLHAKSYNYSSLPINGSV